MLCKLIRVRASFLGVDLDRGHCLEEFRCSSSQHLAQNETESKREVSLASAHEADNALSRVSFEPVSMADANGDTGAARAFRRHKRAGLVSSHFGFIRKF